MSSKCDDNEPKEAISPTQQMIASCSGAIVTSLLVTPLDVVKIRLQAQQKPLGPGSAFIYNNGLMDHMCICSQCVAEQNGEKSRLQQQRQQSRLWYRRPGTFSGTVNCEAGTITCTNPAAWYRRMGQFNGTMDAMVKIARYEGISSLWSGLPPTLVMAVPATVVYFTSYDQLKYALGYDEHDPSTRHVPVIAGATARTGAAVVISPLELLRTKVQSSGAVSYGELLGTVRATIRQCGLGVLMRGLGPTLLRDVPFSAMYWFGYEYFKARQLQDSGRKVPAFSEAFLAGALSGSIAALVTVPFDVIKTHRQIELGKTELAKDQRVTSTWKLIGQLYQRNGVSALFAGTVPRVVKIAPACAIMISSYEFGKSFFRQYNNQQLASSQGGQEDRWT